MTAGAYVGGVTESTGNSSADDQPEAAVPPKAPASLGDLLELHGAAAELIAEAWKALAAYLAADDARVCCARHVSHLMTPDRQQMTIAGVTPSASASRTGLKTLFRAHEGNAHRRS